MTPARRVELLTHPSPGAVLDVVIDCDATNEVDDEFTVAWAFAHPERLNLLGLHACPYGQSPELFMRPGLLADLDRRKWERQMAKDGRTADDLATTDPGDGMRRSAAELRTLVELAGVDVPVREGSTRYLDPHDPERSQAALALVELAHAERSGPLYVAALGCATTVAASLLIDPTIADRVVVLWTSAYPTFWPRPNASFNLAQDVAAGRVLLDSGVPLVYFPGYYVGEELRTTEAEIAAHLDTSGPLGAHLAELYRDHPLVPSGVGRSKVLWDLVCLAWLLDPSWLADDLVPTPWLEDDLRWRHDPSRHLLREAYDLDRDGVMADLFRSLQGR